MTSSHSKAVCVRHQKDLFFRGWDNWPSDSTYYTNMTDQIPTHDQLYFSIKHSSGDFTRPATWNNQLGVGKHAQIVEVELQREYEGKASYPNYVMHGVIDGFPEMSSKKGLADIVATPQMKGLWTWSRGGGWWGPYIHGNEIWVDLHARVLAKWWNSQQQAGRATAATAVTTAATTTTTVTPPLTEAAAFAAVCPGLLPGCTVTNGCCTALRNFSLSSAEAVLLGQWGTVQGGTGARFMRDDRMNDVTSHLKGMRASERAAAVEEKVVALALQATNMAVWESNIRPHVTDRVLSDKIDASVRQQQMLLPNLHESTELMLECDGVRLVRHQCFLEPAAMRCALLCMLTCVHTQCRRVVSRKGTLRGTPVRHHRPGVACDGPRRAAPDVRSSIQQDGISLGNCQLRCCVGRLPGVRPCRGLRTFAVSSLLPLSWDSMQLRV